MLVVIYGVQWSLDIFTLAVKFAEIAYYIAKTLIWITYIARKLMLITSLNAFRFTKHSALYGIYLVDVAYD